MIMGLFAWLVLGLVAGYVASVIVNNRGEGMLLDMVLGIVGAMFGGWIFNTFGDAGITGFNAWSLMVAIIGAVLVLLMWHALRRNASVASLPRG